MSLLRKASIVTTPTAYENGKILSVKPSIPLGNELVVNGNFSTDLSGWILSASTPPIWYQGMMKMSSDGATFSFAKQSFITKIGLQYTFVINKLVNTSSINIQVGTSLGASDLLNVNVTTIQEHVYTITATTTTTHIELSDGGSSDGAYIGSVSLKEVLDGDFDFTRNSSATRVNSQGLIEDMQILSGDLVSNGDFSQIGSELVTNGDFATNTDWGKETGWTISGGSLVATSVTTGLAYQAGIVEAGKTYKATYDAVVTSGSISLYFDGGIGYKGTTTTTQTITVYFYATSSSPLYFRSNISNFTGSIDNVSIKEVGQDWTLGTGWSIGTNKAIYDNLSTSQISQSFVWELGKQYKITFNVADFTTSQRFDIYTGSSFIKPSTIDNDTSYTIYFNGDGGNTFRFRSFVTESFSITNVSVIEITDDTNLPRIDYTGGVGHWLFESQSTNLLPYSEDLTQWGNVLYTLVESNSTLSPDGSVNADKLVAGATNGLQLRIAALSLSSGNTYTFSTYVKNSGGNYVILYMNDTDSQGIKVDLVNETFVTMGSSTNHFIKNFGNGWYQIGFTRAIDANVNGLNAVPSLDGNNVSFLGDGVNGVFIWGTQVEESSFATSYIPTSGSTVTRLAEAAFGSGSSDLINSTEGVLYAEIAALANDGTNRVITLGDNTSSNAVSIQNDTINKITGYVNVGGANQCAITASVNTLLFNKCAIKYKANDFSFWVNGFEAGIDTSGIVFPSGTLDRLNFDIGYTSTNPFYEKTKCVAVFKEALTDAELECLSSWNSFTEMAIALEYTIE